MLMIFSNQFECFTVLIDKAALCSPMGAIWWGTRRTCHPSFSGGGDI